ncbi:uncharacterized protein LOC6542056 [Drosophila erecta]|uniref:Uncharacterized protein n=1 Tax=Drosophila erecta TaxID=7220 RepID=B3N629_DROER|nr:uncharacterized protein LOC6542056 [Drosophila erecta]EDV58067.1 uncharacterized protein Dere_GG25179 [Drosophila erecta]
MKLKYQKKHQPLDPVKQALRKFARVLGKALLYLGTPPLCPIHQSSALDLLHCHYLCVGVCPICVLSCFPGGGTSCSSPYSSCCGNSTTSSAPCKSSTKSRRPNKEASKRSGIFGGNFETRRHDNQTN